MATRRTIGRAALALAILPALAGCGGMNRAVGVLPNALDDLAAVRERPPAEPAPEPASAEK